MIFTPTNLGRGKFFLPYFAVCVYAACFNFAILCRMYLYFSKIFTENREIVQKKKT